MRHQDYKVGWICAVHVESVVAIGLLDERHSALPTHPQDCNAYTLGKIGKHNVVIAHLPSGKYGTVSAAVVAKDMLRSFESIRIGLMVGIGGGAPSKKHDIRLGDVVVAIPKDSSGGIVNYDHGKALHAGTFERTGSLNSSPNSLLMAVSKLRADLGLESSHFVNIIEEMVKRYPKLQGDYRSPGIVNDRLYEPNYPHRNDDNECDVCCCQEHPQLVERNPRTIDPHEPIIHYGLIASANTLMKDARCRDTLAKEHNILCFEMEAAGLMDNFPCVVIRGICDYSDSHKNDMWQGYAAATAASYAKELLSVIPADQIASAQTAAEEMFSQLIFSVPFEQDRHFVDRPDIFSRIEDRLRETHRTSLFGLGGVGKSQIAIEYAYRYRRSHPQTHIFWIYAANATTFLQEWEDIARILGLPGYDDPQKDKCRIVSEWLRREDHSWLLILDNADDAKLDFSLTDPDTSSTVSLDTLGFMERYLPSIRDSQKALLVTTRNRSLGENLCHRELCIEVLPFSLQEAKQLLQSQLRELGGPIDPRDMERLLEILGYIPLAITQAAAYVQRTRSTVQSYLSALQTSEQGLTDRLSQEIWDHRRPEPSSVFQTWQLSFNQVLSQEPLTARLLSHMAMLDSQRIPRKLLGCILENDNGLTMALGTLMDFALVSVESGGDNYTIHPLIRTSIHYWLDRNNDKITYMRQAVKLLAGLFTHSEWLMSQESLTPHAQAVLCFQFESADDLRSRAHLLNAAGSFDYYCGRYISAFRKLSEAYQTYKHQLGDTDPMPRTNAVSLARVLFQLGKYESAEELAQQVLDHDIMKYGKKHPDSLDSIHNLATMLTAQGKFDRAEELYRLSIRGIEEENGPGHRGIINSLNSLGYVLQGQRRWPEAEEINRRAFEGAVEALGEEHEVTLGSMNNLALVLSHQKKMDEAEAMNSRALLGHTKKFDAQHPDTLTCLFNLGVLLKERGKYGEAESTFKKAIEGRTRALGFDHPRTVFSIGALASLYNIQHMYNDARILYSEALAGLLKSLGEDHPNTRGFMLAYIEMEAELWRKRNLPRIILLGSFKA